MQDDSQDNGDNDDLWDVGISAPSREFFACQGTSISSSSSSPPSVLTSGRITPQNLESKDEHDYERFPLKRIGPKGEKFLRERRISSSAPPELPFSLSFKEGPLEEVAKKWVDPIRFGDKVKPIQNLASFAFPDDFALREDVQSDDIEQRRAKNGYTLDPPINTLDCSDGKKESYVTVRLDSASSSNIESTSFSSAESDQFWKQQYSTAVVQRKRGTGSVGTNQFQTYEKKRSHNSSEFKHGDTEETKNDLVWKLEDTFKSESKRRCQQQLLLRKRTHEQVLRCLETVQNLHRELETKITKVNKAIERLELDMELVMRATGSSDHGALVPDSKSSVCYSSESESVRSDPYNGDLTPGSVPASYHGSVLTVPPRSKRKSLKLGSKPESLPPTNPTQLCQRGHQSAKRRKRARYVREAEKVSQEHRQLARLAKRVASQESQTIEETLLPSKNIEILKLKTQRLQKDQYRLQPRTSLSTRATDTLSGNEAGVYGTSHRVDRSRTQQKRGADPNTFTANKSVKGKSTESNAMEGGSTNVAMERILWQESIKQDSSMTDGRIEKSPQKKERMDDKSAERQTMKDTVKDLVMMEKVSRNQGLDDRFVEVGLVRDKLTETEISGIVNSRSICPSQSQPTMAHEILPQHPIQLRRYIYDSAFPFEFYESSNH